jgi:hypothetical protein
MKDTVTGTIKYTVKAEDENTQRKEDDRTGRIVCVAENETGIHAGISDNRDHDRNTSRQNGKSFPGKFFEGL